MNAANLSHCARFVFLFRAINETESPSYLQEAKTHAIIRAHHAPGTSVAFRPVGSTSIVILFS